MGDDIPHSLVMHELQQVLIKKELHRGRKFLIGLPELQDHINVLKNRNAIGDISFSRRHAA